MLLDGEQGHGFNIVIGSDDQRRIAAYAIQSRIQSSRSMGTWPTSWDRSSSK
jgi:hypothetical protein